jgi:flavin reductase (DIM6/NTAB) family NADH-FMN oxidoreductase RutF
MKPMVASSERVSPEVNEFDLAGVTPVPSVKVGVPRVGESPVSMECLLERSLTVYSSHLFLGRVILYHVRDDLLRDGMIDVKCLHPLGRLGGTLYTSLGEILDSSEE